MYPNFQFSPRGRTKFYITFVEMVAWAHNITESTTESSEYHDAYSKIQQMFSKAQTLFNGTLTYTDPQSLHDEEPKTIHYPQIIDPLQTAFLINYYLENYDERLLEQPIEVGKFNFAFDVNRPMSYDDAMYAALDKICKMIDKFTVLNSEKYLRRLALLNLKYNPIDNYDGHELEDLGYEGSESMDREIKASQLSGLKITGPSNNASITMPTGTNPGSLSGQFDNDYAKGSVVAQVSDTQNGKTAGTVSISSGSPSTNTSTGTEIEEAHYTTTYDDASRDRLESYDVNKGDVASTTKGVSEEDVPTMIEAYSGAPGSPSYTDTKNFTGRKDKRELLKWGNMGTMTTQNMIEQEKEMLNNCWGVVQDFCEELNHEIFLSLYSF